jgi:hypothetical protein
MLKYNIIECFRSVYIYKLHVTKDSENMEI